MGEPQRLASALLRLVQLLPNPFFDLLHSDNGSWNYEHDLDHERFTCGLTRYMLTPMKIAVLVLVLAIAVPAQRPPRQQKQPSASADSTKTTQPTLEETLAFLKERITADAFYKEESNENTKHVRT